MDSNKTRKPPVGGRIRNGLKRAFAALLAVSMATGGVTVPAHASTQLEESIPFEYGQGAITDLTHARMVGQTGSFRYEGKTAYPIQDREKGDRYLEFKDAGTYIGSDGKNHGVDMRAYIWAYQEDEDGEPNETDKAHPFVWIDGNGIANVYSSRMPGEYSSGYGQMYHDFEAASNGGVFMEYHFYEAGTTNEISFKGVMTYNDIDGITDRNDAVNEGIALISGADGIVRTTTTTIQEQDRAGYLWYQGSISTEDILGQDGLDQNAQKLTIKFNSTPDDPLRIAYRLNTCQSDGRVDGYGYTFTNQTVCISYMIPESGLPKLSSNQTSKQLIEAGGGEQQRKLDYGTRTNGSDAQDVLNMPAKEVEGYTFDGWYTNDGFTDASRWNGSDSITDSLVLYGRYVNNEYTLNCRYVDEATGTELGAEQPKKFKYGAEVSTTPKTFTTDKPDTNYQVVSYTVNGGEKIPCGTGKNIHFDSSKRTAGDVDIVYYYRIVDNTGTVEIHHVIESTRQPLEDGKYDETHTGALGETCHASPVTVAGWKATKVKIGNDPEQTISTGVTPTYTQPPTVVYFYYEPDEDSAGLTVRYVYDGDPEVELTTPSDRVTGTIGQKVNANNIRKEKEQNDLDSAFTGLEFLGVKSYRPDGTYEIIPEGDSRFSAATNVTLSDTGKDVTFVYRVRGTDIIVRHISNDSCDNGKVLRTEDRRHMATGSVFTASPDSFTGYELTGDSGNTVYTVKDSDNGKTVYIDYYYQHEIHKVTVHHRDTDGNNFVWKNADTGEEVTYGDDVKSYHYGQQWNAVIKPHYGYSVVPAEEASGTMGQEDVEVTYVYAPNPAKVIVHYVSTDNGNAEIITPKTFTEWSYGDSFTVYAKNDKVSESDAMELSRWTLVDPAEGLISGKVNKFGDDAVEVTFYYTQADATVTVKHVWVNGNGTKEDITTPQIYTGQIGKTKWTSAPWAGADNAGFVLDQRPTIESGTMESPSLTVEYVYVKKTADLTVNFMRKDSDGNLTEFGLTSTERRVSYGDAVQLEPKTYPDYAQARGYRVTEVRQSGANGWTATKSGDEITGFGGTVNTDRITVTFVYEPVTVTVTTQYRDTANGTISGPDASKAKDWVQHYDANTKYKTHDDENLPPSFYGYEWTGRHPANASGTLSDEDVTVIYQYSLKQTGYTVRYMDTEGNRLSPDKEYGPENGDDLHVFDSYDERPLNITGYEYKGLAEDSAPAQGTLEELDKDGNTRTVITFVYDRAPSDVVVRYLDTEGNTLLPQEKLEGRFGQPFNASPKDIEGWTLCSVEATGDVTVNDAKTVSGSFGSITQTVKFIYTRTETSVVVNHIDEETKNSISETVVINGESGDHYEAEKITLYGYSYVGPAEGSASPSGEMTDGVLIVTLMYRRNDATVTTRFVDNITGGDIKKDKKGGTVENPVVIKGRYKDLYDTQPAEIYGWKLVKTPENASGAMIDGNIDVVYRYEEYIPKVTVKYVDASDGHEVSEPEEITGATGTRYETTAKDYDSDPERYPELYGYTLTGIPENASGVFGEEDITVTYRYERKTRTITVLYVEYVDGEMVEIAEAETLADLTVGDRYTTNAKTIPGYELVGDIPDNAKGYVTEKPITVIYVYQKSQATVKVRYVNEVMEDIAPSVTIAGHIGDEYTTFAKTIRGYQVAGMPANWKGTMLEKETYVTYVYKVATVTVTARYIDADTGEQLRNNITKTYPMNAEYTTEALEFHGYTLTEMPSNATGTAGNPNGEVVIYYYTKKDAFVTAKYVTVEDGAERQLSVPVVQTGNVGEEYRTSQKDIPGYRFDHVDGETTGRFVKGNTVVTYYYTALEAKVVAQYVDTNGAVIADEVTITGHVNDTYDTEQKEIEGYMFVSVTPNASGTMTEKTIYVVYTYRAKDSTVITYHVNEKGEQIADTVYETYRRNATYRTEAKEIYGYTLTDTPANAYGNADKDVVSVTYVYRLLPATVEVRYMDGDGNALAPAETITGHVFDPYKTEAKEFEGYVLSTKPANASGTMTAETITVTYRYEKQPEKADAEVIVKYVDEDGKEIAPSEKITGKEGDKYSTKPKDISGYLLKEQPSNASGTMTGKTTEVTYTYRKLKDDEKKDAKITIKHVDEDGKDISEPEEIKGKIGDTYKTKEKEIKGYTLKEKPSNAEGTIDKTEITVTYVYRKNETAKVTVKYVDEDGKEIAPVTSIEGTVGDEYTTEPKEIEGYELVMKPDNASGKIGKDGNEVVYTYRPIKQENNKAKVTVKYVDTEGKEIAPETVLEGKEGDSYEAKAKEIKGYILKTTPENAKGKMTKEGITVTFVYALEEVKKEEAVITVKYVDENGRIISQSTTIKGTIGDSYEAKAKEIKGYTLKTTPENAKGKIDKGITVIFVYSKNVAADAKVIVLYKENVNGNEISARTTITGKVGDSYTTKAKTISGYTLKTTPSNSKGVMTEKDIEVVYLYEKKASTEISPTLTVKKTASQQTVTTGSDIKYTVTVTASGNDARNVIVEDTFEQVLTTSSTTDDKPFVLDLINKKIHSTSCKHLGSIPEVNKATLTRSYNVLIKGGYTPATDCDPKKDVQTSSTWKYPDISVNKGSIKITGSNNRSITAKEIKYGANGLVTIILDEIKKGETVTITYTATASSASLIGQKLTNNVKVKSDNAAQKSASASVTVKDKTSTPTNTVPDKTNNNTPDKNTGSTTTIKNNNTTTNKNNSNWVQTGDAYAIIFVVAAGVILTGGLAYILLRKKK